MRHRVLVIVALVVLVTAPPASGRAHGRQPPGAPTKLHVKATGRTSLQMTWKASADTKRVTGYYVYRSGRRVASVKKATTRYTFKGLQCGRSYVVGVAAHDAKNTTSKRPTIRGSTSRCRVSVDTQAPSVPSNLHVTASSASSLTVAWDGSGDNVGVTGYGVYLTGVRIATTTATSYTLAGLSCAVSYAVSVNAYDAAGNTSGQTGIAGTTAACPTPPDTQAPTQPTELRVTASSGSSLTVAWTAASDNVGVSGYRIYRAGMLVATSTATQFILTGLNCGTWYTIAVDAVDAAANASTRATLTDATDGCAPPAPSGGTLRVDLNTDVDYTDPSISYYLPAWQLLYSTGLQLYNYPDKPAPEGSRLVHEAAAGFPLITDGGKTYTITVKPGLKFSDGTPVTAANFAYAINRVLNPQMQSQLTPFIDGTFGAAIVGAQDVMNGKTTTASGVQIDGDKLIIKLVQADGGFLARLSLPAFQAIETNMPINPVGVAVYPSAGPYYISARTPNSSITLQRNPYYTGTRPANADQIQYTIGKTLSDEELRVINGQTDLGGFPAADDAALAATYGVNAPDGQFHVNPQNEVDYVTLNTSRAPFNNVNLRKAVNYAIDRPALLAARGLYSGTVTDQTLSPVMAGYHDAQIYPLDGPDYATAKALAGNSCGTIKLWGSNSSLGTAQANIVKTNLEQIGCTVQLTLMPRAQEFEMAGTLGADFDAEMEAWGVDYPDPSDFVGILFDGATIKPTGNSNKSYFDNPDINAKLAAASLLTGDTRYDTYGNLDAEIMTNHAPIAPFLTRSAREFTSARVRGYVYQPFLQQADLNTFFIKTP